MHPVAYFSLENLKGGAVSLTVGVFLYILVVRAWLMGKGDPRYLDRWPGWIDLENLIYRPLVRAFLAVSLLGCRAMDSLADALILAARKTTHSQVFLAGAMGGKGGAVATGLPVCWPWLWGGFGVAEAWWKKAFLMA